MTYLGGSSIKTRHDGTLDDYSFIKQVNPEFTREEALRLATFDEALSSTSSSESQSPNHP